MNRHRTHFRIHRRAPRLDRFGDGLLGLYRLPIRWGDGDLLATRLERR